MTVDATPAGRVAALPERRRVLDAEGARLADRTMRRATFVAMVANAFGVFDVFALLFWILPSPPGEVDTAANLVAIAVYVPLSFVVGHIWGVRLVRPAVAWLREGREPSEEEREQTLRVPLYCAMIDGTFWVAA